MFRLNLLGDVLADLLGDRLALLPGHLALNVPAVLHLRQDDMGKYDDICFLKSHLVLARDLLALR